MGQGGAPAQTQYACINGWWTPSPTKPEWGWKMQEDAGMQEICKLAATNWGVQSGSWHLIDHIWEESGGWINQSTKETAWHVETGIRATYVCCLNELVDQWTDPRHR